MQLTSSPRRALGLLALSAVGMSTTVLSLGGVAQAAAVETTDPFAVTYDHDGATDTWTVPAGYCSVDWLLEGAEGGAGDQGGPGASGGTLKLTTYFDDIAVPTTFTLAPGAVGGDATTGVAGAGGVSPLDPDVNGGAGAVGSDTIAAGGGGGAATVVTGSDNSELIASGGRGGSGVGELGGIGGNGEVNYYWAMTSDPGVDGVGDGGAGSISATANLCAPATPSAWLVGDDGKLSVHLSEGVGGEAPTTGYQYTRDDGDNWLALPTTTVDGRLVGTISGLTNGTSYTVQVRAIAGNGAHSEATAPQTAMAYKPIGAPTDVVATAGPSSIVITWDAPTTAGSFELAGYVVGGDASSADGTDGASGIACETAADVRRCVLVAEPGWTHTFGVTPVDSAGNPGVHSASVTVTDVPRSVVSPTLPEADGALTSSATDGKVVAGSEITVSGAGFLPGSTVALVVYSTPVELGDVVVLADGTFSATVTLPADLTDGVHHVVASGVDADGNVRNLVVEVTVSGGTAVLANTGFSALPVLGAGGLALLAGGGLLVAARRRTAA
ncbi:fibronectin type III domain-containing protein [Blastococcus goldschmidtiae]|uniref:Fibronectin type III domain-containing protein n=1 Tax=Blastococcus goldschmidtiae TaxID=3075546 RepID=A0ABU2KAT8_9ACTN|nr:fibronectin type III domain-containing protein [Blastococcus sp. DSM 46792]MDT0277307.1 fibronectin type III domain-containing protein [Blastococcus sp. DSM 46792]